MLEGVKWRLEGGLVGEGKGRRVEGKGKAAGREGRAVGREGVRWWEGVERLLGGQCWRRDHHGGREVGGGSRKAREARSIGRALRREAGLQWGSVGRGREHMLGWAGRVVGSGTGGSAVGGGSQELRAPL